MQQLTWIYCRCFEDKLNVFNSLEILGVSFTVYSVSSICLSNTSSVINKPITDAVLHFLFHKYVVRNNYELKYSPQLMPFPRFKSEKEIKPMKLFHNFEK